MTPFTGFCLALLIYRLLCDSSMAKAEVPEDWEKELLITAPGRLVYMGQGQAHDVHFHQETPDPLWPKKKKKKASTPQPPPVPELRPV
jgi:hypothetical protein